MPRTFGFDEYSFSSCHSIWRSGDDIGALAGAMEAGDLKECLGICGGVW